MSNTESKTPAATHEQPESRSAYTPHHRDVRVQADGRGGYEIQVFSDRNGWLLNCWAQTESAANAEASKLRNQILREREGKTAYTPGPWRISSTFNILATIKGSYANQLIELPIAHAAALSRYPSQSQEANASLIAAAPALYEALEAYKVDRDSAGIICYDTVCVFDKHSARCKQARAALALAKGE